MHAEQGGLIGDQVADLGLALGCIRPGAATEVVRAVVLAELRALGRWLLVFDNAEDPAEVAAWLPGGSGHVLITSGNRAGPSWPRRWRWTCWPGPNRWRSCSTG